MWLLNPVNTKSICLLYVLYLAHVIILGCGFVLTGFTNQESGPCADKSFTLFTELFQVGKNLEHNDDSQNIH